ncbi:MULTISPECIES: helix-turn-helix domain-containing protein [unclassified Sporosarcina]|uniref:helix-turn-helix domain-containing protein n=1 Tax=unclassified Sporosarcina TaxID=2647733 RepID=UPI001304637E|nr:MULTISPECIES: AraC family transcriptional regulator [unclassified Sporosarcina]
MTGDRTEASARDVINGIEDVGGTQAAAGFFKLEKELLDQIFDLKKDEACHTLCCIHDILHIHTPGFTLQVIKYYLIVLSSFVSRRLREESVLTDKDAFTFNAACIELIEEYLHSDNIKEIGGELIGFYYYILKGKIKPSLPHETVNDVIFYINENVESQLIVDEIAKHFNVSTSHLSRIFRECTGITLVEYITMRKIEEVQYHLRFTDQKIADIAKRFHFCNQSYFTRVFKKYTGVTPRRFRMDMDGNYFHFTLEKDDSL